MLENDTWEKAVNLSEALKEAVMNPNTDFMTKLIFDAKFLQKKTGKELTHWSNAIVKLKLCLHENKGSDLNGISKNTGLAEKDLQEIIPYLKNMSEILEENGKYSLNYTNLFSKPFK